MDENWKSDLERWLAPFLDALRPKVRARMCPAYVAGLIGAGVPYKIHTVLTDNGVQFVQHDKGAKGSSIAHVFGRICAERHVEHRLTKPYHPWTNGQAERMVRTIKDATVRAFHYTSIDNLRRHVRDWLLAYNYAKQLKALRFRTPLEAIKQISAEKPELFVRQPSHDMLGLNS